MRPTHATMDDRVDIAPVVHAAAAAAAVTAQIVAAGDGGKHDDGGVQTRMPSNEVQTCMATMDEVATGNGQSRHWRRRHKPIHSHSVDGGSGLSVWG